MSTIPISTPFGTVQVGGQHEQQEAAIHRLIAQDYAAKLYLSFHEEPIPFERDGTTYAIVAGNLDKQKIIAKLSDGDKQYETLEISEQEAASLQKYCYQQLYHLYTQDERAHQCQAEPCPDTLPDDEHPQKQVASTACTTNTETTPAWQATLTEEQRQYVHMAQQIALEEREQRQLVEQENQHLRQHITRIEETFDTDINTLIAGDESPRTVPYPLYAKEHERRLQTEKQQDRLFSNPGLKPAQKLGLHYLQRQVERGQTHDNEGRTRINATTIAKQIGMSPSTGERLIDFCKEQLPGFIDWAKHPEIGPDGSEIERTYLKFADLELLHNPEHITPLEHKKQGGNRYICPLCGSKHVTIKRKITRTLICNDCKHTVEIDTTETEHTFEDDQPEEKQVASDGFTRNTTINTHEHKKIYAEESNLTDIIKPVTPPVLRKLQDALTGDDNQASQDNLLNCDEQEAAIALYQAIAGVDSGHIEMIPKPQKWTKVLCGITVADIMAHIVGRKTIGTRLYHEGGMTRAFLVDADNEEDLARLRAGAQKLAAAGFFPILDSPPVGRPRQVEGFHDISEHGWIVMDVLVSRQAGWMEIVRLAPEWGELKERWPALAEKSVGNRVRLPGGRYVMPGFAGFSMLASVRDGEYAQTGVDQARLLLAHQTPVSLIPSVPQGVGGESKEEMVGPSPLPASSTSPVASKEQHARAGGDRPLPVVDEQWIGKYGPVETTTFYFAVTEAYSVAWFNEHHPLESICPRERNGKALSPNGSERTASTGYWESSEGERYTDFSAHGLRADGSHDTGDAFELACKLWKCSKSELSQESMRDILRLARAELETAARAGREPAARVCALITPAGWRHYDSLQSPAGACAIYVDEIRTYETALPHKHWCHMATDGDSEQLHAFARRLGLDGKWFQDKPNHPHYDLTPGKRAQAIKLGAIPVSTLELVKRCHPAMLLPVPVLEQLPALVTQQERGLHQDGQGEQKPNLAQGMHVSTPIGLATISLMRYCDILHRWRCSVFTEAVQPNGSHYAIFDAAEVKLLEQGQLL